MLPFYLARKKYRHAKRPKSVAGSRIIFKILCINKRVSVILIVSVLLCPKLTVAHPGHETELQAEEKEVSDLNKRPKISVGLIVFPPMVEKSNDGICSGNAIEQINSVLPETEYDLSIYCTTPARVYRDLASGKIDVTVNVKSTESLGENVYFSKEPLYILEVKLYTAIDAKASSVSAIRFFNYHGMRDKLLAENYQFQDHTNSKEAITVFIRGGSDALISYRTPFEYYLEQIQSKQGLAKEGFEYETRDLVDVPTYFVINMSSRHAQHLLEVINQRN